MLRCKNWGGGSVQLRVSLAANLKSYQIVCEFIYSFIRCANGFIGPRCDYKDLDGSYLCEFPLFDFDFDKIIFNFVSVAARSRVMLETASIAGGGTYQLHSPNVVM